MRGQRPRTVRPIRCICGCWSSCAPNCTSIRWSPRRSSGRARALPIRSVTQRRDRRRGSRGLTGTPGGAARSLLIEYREERRMSEYQPAKAGPAHRAHVDEVRVVSRATPRCRTRSPGSRQAGFDRADLSLPIARAAPMATPEQGAANPNTETDDAAGAHVARQHGWLGRRDGGGRYRHRDGRRRAAGGRGRRSGRAGGGRPGTRSGTRRSDSRRTRTRQAAAAEGVWCLPSA